MSDHNKVVYEISLEDLLSGKVRAAEATIHHFESAVHSATHVTRELFSMAVAGFGLYEGLEIIKESVHEYTQVEKYLAQIQAGIESTGGAAGLSFEEIKEHAEAIEKSFTYGNEAVLDMQAQLLTFPTITKKHWEEATTAIMDVATRTGHDLHETSIMMGKALSSERGITAMQRYGVVFSDQQKMMAKHLFATGHAAEAQEIILKELSREYGGSAAAAAKTMGGQMIILQHEFDNVKESLGELIMQEIVRLKPEIEKAIHAGAAFVHWLAENKETVEHTTIAVAEFIATVWGIGKLVSTIEILTSAWALLRTTIVSTGEAAIVTQGQMAVTGAETVTGGAATAAATGGGAMALLSLLFLGLKGDNTSKNGMSLAEQTERNAITESQIKDYATKHGIENYKFLAVYDDIITQILKEQRSQVPYTNYRDSSTMFTDPVGWMKGMTTANTVNKKDDKTHYPDTPIAPKVTGSNPVTYNINIGDLVKNFTIETTNIKESSTKVKELVLRALTDAVNDVELKGVQ